MEPIRFEKTDSAKYLEKGRRDFEAVARERADSLMATTQDFRIVAPVEEASGMEFLSIPKMRIPEMADQYIAWIETEVTDKWCKCIWALHPDDTDVNEGECRICNRPENAIHVEHSYRGRRKRRVEEHPQCPVHTRVGLVLGFFEWLFSPEIQAERENAD